MLLMFVWSSRPRVPCLGIHLPNSDWKELEEKSYTGHPTAFSLPWHPKKIQHNIYLVSICSIGNLKSSTLTKINGRTCVCSPETTSSFPTAQSASAHFRKATREGVRDRAGGWRSREIAGKDITSSESNYTH